MSAFRNWAWGQHFAVSIWFMRSPVGEGNYEGIINNGYYTHGSWEIRMGREMGTRAHIETSNVHPAVEKLTCGPQGYLRLLSAEFSRVWKANQSPAECRWYFNWWRSNYGRA